jgi:hypothetical protein
VAEARTAAESAVDQLTQMLAEHVSAPAFVERTSTAPSASTTQAARDAADVSSFGIWGGAPGISPSMSRHDSGISGAATSMTPTVQLRVAAERRSTSDEMAQFVAGFEHGIRGLTDLLCTQMRGQWRQVKVGLDEIAESRRRILEIRQTSQQSMNETIRFREQAAVASEAANLALRETTMFREDAKKAKERADASADAAEHAANQARREIN